MSSFLLTLASGEQQQIPGTSGKLRIGRLPECEISVSEATVSRHHAEITFKNNSCYIQDVGSANGTLVNEQRINKLTEIFSGDTIRIGNSKLLYQAPDQQTVLHELESSDRTMILSLPVEHPPKDLLAPFGLLETVAEIAKEIVKNRPLAEFLDIILQLCVEKTHAERAALLLLDDSGHLVPRAFFSNTTFTSEFTISMTIAQK